MSPSEMKPTTLRSPSTTGTPLVWNLSSICTTSFMVASALT